MFPHIIHVLFVFNTVFNICIFSKYNVDLTKLIRHLFIHWNLYFIYYLFITSIFFSYSFQLSLDLNFGTAISSNILVWRGRILKLSWPLFLFFMYIFVFMTIFYFYISYVKFFVRGGCLQVVSTKRWIFWKLPGWV